jgi:serine/threonine protein kinase
MFTQMCQAVATCHAVNVFHRDIKPENFIVTDGWVKSSDGRQERKVVVKLTDFGLSTNDVESADMDCGSAPYMSYGMFPNSSTISFTNRIRFITSFIECRNNVAPTYSPRAADVWSLGIVLINMYVLPLFVYLGIR